MDEEKTGLQRLVDKSIAFLKRERELHLKLEDIVQEQVAVLAELRTLRGEL